MLMYILKNELYWGDVLLIIFIKQIIMMNGDDLASCPPISEYWYIVLLFYNNLYITIIISKVLF